MYDPDIIEDLSGMLAEFERTLLDYESCVEKRLVSGERFYGILRPLQSMKALLWQANLGVTATLVHDIESLVTAHQHRAETLSREAIDTLLSATDVMSAALNEPEATRSELRNYSLRLNALIVELQMRTKPGKERSFPFALDAAEAYLCERAQESGLRPLVVEKLLPSEFDVSACEELPIWEILRSIGEVIAVRYDIWRLDRTRREAMVTIVAATSLTSEEVGAVIEETHSFCAWRDAKTPTGTVRMTHSNGRTPDRYAAPNVGTDAGALGSVSRIALGTLMDRSSQTMAHARPCRRILIVEDEFVSRSILLAMLSDLGACDVAVDGKEAVEAYLEAIRARQPYALVTLDIMMPELDGHQVLKELRRIEAASAMEPAPCAKVIMTTALSDYDNVHRAYQGSCDAYIVKPISKAILMRQLRRIGFQSAPAALAGPNVVAPVAEHEVANGARPSRVSRGNRRR